jgi:hypothetical protein
MKWRLSRFMSRATYVGTVCILGVLVPAMSAAAPQLRPELSFPEKNLVRPTTKNIPVPKIRSPKGRQYIRIESDLLGLA